MEIAQSFATCVGVYHFAGQYQQALGKPATKELFDQYANGAEMAALWVYEADWIAEHPNKDPPNYGTFTPEVENIAELERVRLAARFENGDAKSATKALNTCEDLAPSIDKAVGQLKKEVHIPDGAGQ